MDACSRFMPNFDISSFDWPEKTKFGIINRTVGYLMCSTKDWTVVAMELSEEGSPRDITDVPTCLVLEIEVLQKGTEE